MKVLSWLVVLLVAAGAVGAYVFYVPYGPGAETFVDIPNGTSSAGIAERLQAAGILRTSWAFLAMRKVHGGTLRAGEYRFDHPMTVPEVYRRIVKGDVYTRTVVVPEGYNIFDIAQAVETAKLGSAVDFLAAERRDTRLIADLAPGASSLEGFLFPDTYKFSPHATPDQMVATMVKRFRSVAAGLKMPLDPSVGRVVTMASLVEKEVHVDAERPVVAGVFENRLTLGMPLQTDPSVIYAAMLAGRWRGTIYQSDLQADSAYNTYKRVGLPPGPIANPGVAALRAAMRPAQTNYLYFVADASGKTQFSKDMKEHEAQVAAYRAAGGR